MHGPMNVKVFDCLLLKMKELCSFAISANIYQFLGSTTQKIFNMTKNSFINTY